MHEATIAARILAIVEEIARRENAKRVLEVEVHIGELNAVDLETLRFALEALAEGTIAEGASFKLVEVEAKARCKKCGTTWRPLGLSLLHSFDPDAIVRSLRCPNCGSSDYEVLQGKELVVKRITVE